MSSEMREPDAMKFQDAYRAWDNAEGKEGGLPSLVDRVNSLLAARDEQWRALLARTEAGADGVSIWRYRFRNSETGGWHEWRYSDRQPVLNSLVADKTEIQGPFTRPQDASGDAVTGRVNGYMFSARAIEIITDGEVPEWITKAPGLRVTITAMQAKEAK